MKLKLMVLVVLMAAVFVLFTGLGFGKDASSGDAKCLKIGVVSVGKIFQDCKRNAKNRQEFNAEGDKMEAEIDTLSKQIEIGKNSLKMLKPSSVDYLAGMKDIFEKRGQLQAKQDYFKQLLDLRRQTISEQLFKDIIRATEEIAKEKGFDLVLEKSEPDMPNDISTQKVLYSAGCEDITDAVMAKVDANSI